MVDYKNSIFIAMANSKLKCNILTLNSLKYT